MDLTASQVLLMQEQMRRVSDEMSDTLFGDSTSAEPSKPLTMELLTEIKNSIYQGMQVPRQYITSTPTSDTNSFREEYMKQMTFPDINPFINGLNIMPKEEPEKKESTVIEVEKMYAVFEMAASPVAEVVVKTASSLDTFRDEQKDHMIRELSNHGIILSDGQTPISFESKYECDDIDIVTQRDAIKTQYTSNVVITVAIYDANVGVVRTREYHVYGDNNNTVHLASEHVEIDQHFTGPPISFKSRPDTRQEYVGESMVHRNDPTKTRRIAFEIFEMQFQVIIKTEDYNQPHFKMMAMSNMIADLDSKKYIKYRWADNFAENMRLAHLFPEVSFEFMLKLMFHLDAGTAGAEFHKQYDLTHWRV